MTDYVADERARYRIRVLGRLEPLWIARLGEMTMAVHRSGGGAVTDLAGWITDQAALMGVLEQLYGQGVTLLTVERLEGEGSRAFAASEGQDAFLVSHVKEDR